MGPQDRPSSRPYTTEENNENNMYVSGHNIPHVALGGFILVAGFMAFNGGSQASITNEG